MNRLVADASPAAPQARRGWTRRVGVALVVAGALAALLTAMQVSMLGLRTAKVLLAAFAFNAFVSLMIGSSIDLGHAAATHAFALERRGPGFRLAVYVGVVAMAVVVGVEAGVALVSVVAPRTAETFPRAGVLWVAVPVTIVMVAIGRERERMHLRAAQAERDAEVRKRQALRAELSALQSRTNPHFLFNALNTIAALIAEDPKLAERAVERLAALLRFALASGKQVWVPLADELAATTGYIELERLRFGERLCTSIEVDETLLAVRVPPMSLQPLVENAVLHGVAARRAPTTVSVAIRRVGHGHGHGHGQVIELAVSDDGPGDDEHHGTGTAHADLRARLQLLYGGEATIEAGPRPEGGYRVVLRLPESGP